MLHYHTKQLLCLGALALACCAGAPALAELVDERIQLETPIHERVPDELRSKPLAFKGILYRPELNVTSKYTSNVLAIDDSRKSDDYMVKVEPSIEALKKYGPHQFWFGAKASAERFLNRAEENVENYRAAFQGRFEANSDWTFPFSLAYINQSRAREKPFGRQTSTKPLDVNRHIATLGATRNFNRLSLTLYGEYTDIDNADGVALDDDTTAVVFSDNDRSKLRTRLRSRYALSRGDKSDEAEHILFSDLSYERVRYERRQYDDAAESFTGVWGDFDEYRATLGFQTEYKKLLFANAFAGMDFKRFKDRTLSDTNGFILSARVNYLLTPKLALNANISRDNSEDNGFLRGITGTRFHLGADYELRHDTFLSANIGYENHEFEENIREDDDIMASFGLRRHHNPHLTSAIELNYFDRDSTLERQIFDRYELMLRLTGAL